MTSDPTEQRAREVAREIAVAWVRFPRDRDDLTNVIARALLAERRAVVEECAKCADARREEWHTATSHLEIHSISAIGAAILIGQDIRALGAGKD